MHAHMPPFTKPEAAYDSRRLYEETSAIAAAQDAKLDPDNDALPSILADFRAVVNRLGDYAERMRAERNLADMARESQGFGLHNIYWNACFPTRAQLDAAATGKPPLEPSRICTPAELAYLASFAPNADIPEKSPRDDFTIAQDPPDLPMGWLASGGVPVESSYIASFAPKWSPQWLADQGVPADPRKIARFDKDGSRLATADEVAALRKHLTAEQLREYGIGDVEPRHPMHAEALRDHDERLFGGEDRL